MKKINRNERIYAKAQKLRESSLLNEDVDEEVKAEAINDSKKVPEVSVKSLGDVDVECEEVDGADETAQYWVSAPIEITIGDKVFPKVNISWTETGSCSYMGGEGPSWGDDGGDPGYDKYRYYLDYEDCEFEFMIPEDFSGLSEEDSKELSDLLEEYDLYEHVEDLIRDVIPPFSVEWED